MKNVDELERMQKKLLGDARKWRLSNEQCAYVDGVVRGLHEAARSCRRRIKRLQRARK